VRNVWSIMILESRIAQNIKLWPVRKIFIETGIIFLRFFVFGYRDFRYSFIEFL